jgi:hypothetical protein
MMMALRRVRTSRKMEGDFIREDHAEERGRDGEEDVELLWRSGCEEPKGEEPSILPQYCVSYGTAIVSLSRLRPVEISVQGDSSTWRVNGTGPAVRS